MSNHEPEVTVCIPAHKAEAFVGETLECVRQQSFDRLRILVSVDSSSDGTERICRQFAARDPRFDVHAHPRPLGWIGNWNYLLDLVSTDLYFMLPHDDLIGEGYVETLRAALESDPNAVNAYGDIELFGAMEQPFTLDISGRTRFERMLAFLATGPNGIPLRGLTRAWVLRRGLRLRDNRFAGFFAGTVYVLELLGFGGCRRVPESLYRKRVWPGSVHVGEWNSWDHERAMAAWVEHTLACLQAVVKSDVRPRERYVLIAACLVRLQRQLHRDAALDAPSEATPFDELAVTSALAARALGIDDPEGGLADLLKPDGALRRAISNLRLVEAVEQRDRGLPEAAGALFAAAAEIDPTSAEAPLQHSTIHYTLGRLEEGLVQARRAAELAPHDPRPRLMVSRLLAQKGELASAEEAARRALKLAPGNSQIEDHLALLARKAAGDERTA